MRIVRRVSLLCAESLAARTAQRNAADKARRYQEAATRLTAQWEAAEANAVTPTQKKHANSIRRLLEQNQDRARVWSAIEKELTQ